MKYGELNLGQIEALVNVIGGLEVVKSLIGGTVKAVITTAKPIIDMDANPYVPNNWKVESHKKGGQLEWNLERIQLYFSEQQNGDKWIEGNKLRKELKTQSVCNANLLDYLLAHSELIPESWKGKAICFWGTIYRYSDGNLYVRYLCFNGRSWSGYCSWLDDGFGSSDPAVVAGK